MKNELIIRKATLKDLIDIGEISRTTWDGEDYLETVSGEWIKQPGFIVGELQGRVIACGKITPMPAQIAWLEGLRVHSDFRGKGIGRVMSDEILRIVLEKLRSGEFRSIEFSTYINNAESRSMAGKQGFSVAELFHVIGMDDFAQSSSPAVPEEFTPSASDFSVYPLHAPCGWKFIHHCARGSLEWMKANAEFWQVSTGARFLASRRGMEISPLAGAFADPAGFIQGAFALAGINKLDSLELVIHDEHKDILSTALKSGFSYWETPGEANLPVYRFTGK
jgi:GNAT superfamily N-acetyltransferase